MQANTIEILNSINATVSTIAKMMAPQNASGASSVAALSKGISAPKQQGVNIDAKLSSSTMDSVKSLSTISPLVLSFGNVNAVARMRMKKAIDVVIDAIQRLSAISDKKFDKSKIVNATSAVLPAIVEFSKISNVNERQIRQAVSVVVDAINRLGNLNVKKSNAKNISDIATSILPAIVSFSKIPGLNQRQIRQAVNAVVETVERLRELGSKKVNAKNITEAANSILPAIVNFSQISKVNEGQIRNAVSVTISALSQMYDFAKSHSDMDKVAKKLSKSADDLMGVVSNVDKKAKKSNRSGTFNDIMKAVMGLTVVTGAMIGLGSLIANGETKKILLSGLAGLAMVMGSMVAVIGLTGLAGKLIKTTGALSGIKDIVTATMGMGILTAAMIGLGALLTGPNGWNIILKGLAGMAMVLTSTLAIVALTGLASRLIISSKGVESVGLMLGFTFASMGLIVASKFLGDFIGKNNKAILTGLEYTGGVLVGLGVLAGVAGKVLGKAKAGILALGTVELMALGAMGLVVAVTKLADHLKKYTTEELALTVLGIGGVITAFGTLAGIAGIGPVAAVLAIGSGALATVELMAFGAIKLVDAVMGLHNRKGEKELSWKELEKDVLGVSGIVGTFGTLAAAASVLTVPIAVATPALASIAAFSLTCIGVMNKLFDLDKRIQEGGGTERIKALINTDIPAVMKGFSYKNYNPGLNLIQIASLTTKYAAIATLSLEFLATAKALSKLANIGSLMKGKMILPVKSVDKETGEMTFGEPVDIVATATTITDTVKIFVQKCNFGFKDVAKMMTSAAVFRLLGSIVNPITKFINMLTGFISEGGTSLTPIRMDDQGNIHMGEKVDVAQVAGVISNTISFFVGELYSDKNATTWAQYVYGKEDGSLGMFKNKKTRAIKKVAGILGTIVSPISDFMEMLTTMQGDATGESLTPFTLDAEGNIVAGQPIFVRNTAATISGAITTFLTGLFSEANVKSWNELDRKGRKALETVFTSLTDLIGVVRDLGDDKKINNENLELNIASVQKLMDAVYIQDFEKVTEKMDKFSKSTLQLKINITDLDRVFVAENNKRKKNIEEFGNSIESLLKKFENADKSISSLYQLVLALQNMDANRVSSIISSMNLNNYKGGTNVPAQGGTQNNITPAQRHLTENDIANAIRIALDGMHITGGTTSENQSMDDSANAIVAALRDLRLDLDLN